MGPHGSSAGLAKRVPKEKTYDFILWNSDVEADVLIDIIALPVGDCIVLGLVLCPAVLVSLGHVGTLGLGRVHWYTYVSTYKKVFASI